MENIILLNLSVVIPYYNGQDTIVRLIESIPNRLNILIVDDVSTVPLPSLKYPNVKIIRLSSKGYFAGAVNEGILKTENDVIVLNQDTYFTGDSWIPQLEKYISEGYHYIGERIKGDRPDWENGYIHGTYMYISREAINKTGLLNNNLYPMWGCTAEYQLRVARNNLKIMPLEYVHSFVHVRPDVERFGKSFKSVITKNNIQDFTRTPPLVSVIIPTHNFSKWLHSTVNSLIGGDTDLGEWPQQTFASFEVIIVDDSSTDDTPEIIKSIVNSWKGVRTIRLNRPYDEVWDDDKNKYIGKPKALNEGIKRAYGKYIVVLDADDMMHSERLEKMFQVIHKNNKAVVYDNVEIFAEGKVHKTWILQDYDFDKCLYKNQVHNSIMFTKEAWVEVGGYPERFKYGREDWAMNIRLGSHGYCGVKLDYEGLLYRREGQNRTIENTKPEWMTYFQKQMLKEFPSLYKGERKMGCCGKKPVGAVSKTQVFVAARSVDIGIEGTTMITYDGNRSSGESFTVYGFYTGTPYRITPGKDFRADNRDLTSKNPKKPGLLEMYEGNKFMFSTVEVEVVVDKAVLELESVVVQDFSPELSLVSEVLNVDTVEVDYSVLDKTVSVFEQAVIKNNYTEYELELLLAYELVNKNRLTVVKLIEGKLYGENS